VTDDIVTRLRQAEWYCNRSAECMGTCDKRHARRNCPDPDTSHEAADEIVRLRAVLDAIASLHTPRHRLDPTWCHPCDDEWPCATYLLIHPMTLDEAINTLGTVHK
jgi:hypothetical protein